MRRISAPLELRVVNLCYDRSHQALIAGGKISRTASTYAVGSHEVLKFTEGLTQLSQQVSRRKKISGLEALGESVVHRCENSFSFVLPILFFPHTGEAERRPQFPKKGLLFSSQSDRTEETTLGCRRRLGCGMPEHHLALDAQEFGNRVTFTAVFRSRQSLLDGYKRHIELSKPDQSSRQNAKKLCIADMPARLVACIQHCSQQRASSRELATLDQRLAFPVIREDFPKSCIKSRCNIVHGRHTPIGGSEITRQQRDRTYGMMQHPAKCEPGIGGFRFFQTYPGLFFGLIGITLQAKDTCQSRSGEHALVVLNKILCRPLAGGT